jgi:S1-C subfamily serine protease
VTAINGNDVGSAESLRAALSTMHPGDSVRVTYVGPDGSQHQATVKLGTGTPD